MPKAGKKLFPQSFQQLHAKTTKGVETRLGIPQRQRERAATALRFMLCYTSACPPIGKNIQLKTNRSQIMHTLHVMGWRLCAPMLTREELVSPPLNEMPYKLLLGEAQTGKPEFTAFLVYHVSCWAVSTTPARALLRTHL